MIIDFGLSKALEDPNDHMATRVGTPYYIAPEVRRRRALARGRVERVNGCRVSRNISRIVVEWGKRRSL